MKRNTLNGRFVREYNFYRMYNNVGILEIQGQQVLFDPEDLPKISGHRWHLRRRFPCIYAATSIKSNGRYKAKFMHRLLLAEPKGKEVDHINRNGLDNRKVNLRLATRAENNRNASKRKDNTSGFRGVHQLGQNRWQARIQVNGIRKSLGVYPSPETAASIYDLAAIKYYGEFAMLNNPKPSS